ncbi:MAG: Eco57I restriction-modification methylase domain-containing protein, partial [Anaerolineae bacterium]|nr:Eco57I restriction-modification methylase domain-containing protein [Anaerolineae bacterium]
STPLDVEVAVDPEMLGKIFEELVTGRHETGSYYTPKPVVSFMGREALKGYLGTVCSKETTEAIEQFVDHQNPEGLDNPEVILEALKSVTICDPACGSGAYLLGMLQELLMLRNNLFRGDRKLDDITGYERKLAIIENNLYGVDIDPFAVNIARLRLWLSLIVDFEGNDPPPLPNLDFKIEVGDSVLGPDPSGGIQPDLIRHGQIETYKQLKAKYLNAHGGEKQTLYQKVLEQRQAIADWVQGGGQANGFDWAVDFAEVFDAGGFDIVITNPPYVRMELIKELKPVLQRLYNDFYTGRADLYVYFYARALQLAKSDGRLVFISSNKWLRAGYGEKLRRYLADETSVQVIVDFGDLPVFTATAYPCISVISNHAPTTDHAFHTLVVQDIGVIEHIGEEMQTSAWNLPQTSLRPDGWTLVQPDVLALMNKLRQSGARLDEYVEGKFYRGIVTGLNEAFVIDEATRAQLIAKDSHSAEVIKPWLRGKDIRRWSVDWAGLHIIFVYHGIDISRYPAIEEYLGGFKAGLMRRVTLANHEWYELQQPQMGIYPEFDKHKIIYPHFNVAPSFAYDDTGAFSNDKTYFIPEASAFVLGVLNSRVTSFFLRQITPSVQQGYMELRVIYVSQIPIPNPASVHHEAIEAIVRRLLDLRGQGPEVVGLEAELNALVYQVYGLTDEEIALIEADLQAGEARRGGQEAPGTLNQEED